MFDVGIKNFRRRDGGMYCIVCKCNVNDDYELKKKLALKNLPQLIEKYRCHRAFVIGSALMFEGSVVELILLV